MAGLGWKAWTRERLSSAQLQGYLQDQVRLTFPSASARAAVVTAPSEGMESWLVDADYAEDYVNGAWRKRSGRALVGFPQGTLQATNNLNLASSVCNPGRPYRAHVRIAGQFTVGAGATGSLRLFDTTPDIQMAQQLTPAAPSVEAGRYFDVADGAAHTFYANLEVLAGAITYYTDTRHAFLEVTWTAL